MTAPYYRDEHVTLWCGDCLERLEWLEAERYCEVIAKRLAQDVLDFGTAS